MLFNFFKDLPLHVQELITRMKNRNPTAPFPASLKTFARTLHFHTPAAYDVVRNSFLKCLPCVQTLNNWIGSKQYKPGISEDTINNVSSMVREEMKTGKQIIFNVTFDEMHIKQHKFWDENAHSNYFAIKGPLIYNKNEYIHWSFIKKLNDKQQKEKLHCASKIRNRHVNFYTEKMKVCLAAQVLSNSTALALHFNEITLNDMNFAHSSATAHWKSMFKNKASKVENVTTRKSVIVCDSVSTGFVGFIISLQNLYNNLSKYLIDNNFVDYVLSYKLSQDHVEMFFSSLRRMNGNNNNPTVTQYLSAYKKVLRSWTVIQTGNSGE
ncbi:hypothetical protein ALC62_04443 [Cyphomyrmex costatus]|uniref:THAP domain-containing protein 9 n=1 Tax=Cyphomyrmex costatus TaxID=456900 RepID=A0A151IK83_9HYME|nr:hypothetical protein ALC62_04443 [Cyphomyrmex costatus]